LSYVITLTGPSRAGKSTTVKYLLELAGRHGFKPELVPKYTTRSPRDDDSGEMVYVDKIPSQCDLVYEQYSFRYGLEMRVLSDFVTQGQNPIVILNDVRAVEDVRNFFGEQVRSIFIFRQDPSSPEYRQELMESRGGGRGSEVRLEKAKTIYRIYIENIHLFDHVIVNSGTYKELATQVIQLVKSLE
jgi:guanylate kinase